MNPYDETHDPKNPADAAMHPKAHSAALFGFVGSLVVFFVLVGVVLVFWTVAHPTQEPRDSMEKAVGTSGAYSTEGGHDPIRRPGNTQDELKFRGRLTPPNEGWGR
jgi:hypothetical protein